MSNVTRIVLLGVMVAFVTLFTALRADTQTPDKAQYRGPCLYSQSKAADPIGLMPHEHDFLGSTADITNDTTYTDLRAGETNCRRPDDKSAYWMPALKWGDVVVKPYFSGFYFQAAPQQDARKTRPFPKGFQMITNDTIGEVDWACTTNQNSGNVQPIPPENCSDLDGDGKIELGLRVTFPNCWDQQPATPGQGHSLKWRKDNGECPASHPRQLPTLIMWPDYILPDSDGPISVSVGHGEFLGPERMHADAFIGFDDAGMGYTERCINRVGEGLQAPDVCDGNTFFK